MSWTAPSQLRQHWHLPLLLLVTLLVFSPGLLNPAFVYDDALLLVDNPALTSLWGVFSGDLWAGVPGAGEQRAYYRPGVLFSFFLDRAVFGDQAFGFRLHSLVLHMLAVGLLWTLGKRWRLPTQGLLAGVALFAVHPAQVEAVVFVAARNDVQALCALLGALLLLRVPTVGRLAGAAALIALGTLCKESLVLAPLAYLASVKAQEQGWGDTKGYLAIFAGLGVALLARMLAGVGFPHGALDPSVLPGAWGGWSQSLLWPVDLAPGAHVGFDPVPWGSAALGVVLVGLLIWRGGGWGLLLGAALLIPALGGVGATGLVADRYLYGALAGLGLGLAAVVRRVPSLEKAALALPMLGLLTIPTAANWDSDLILWSQAVRTHPNPYTHGAYAKALYDAEDPIAALVQARLATRGPVYDHSCYNVVRWALEVEGPESAVQTGNLAIEAGCGRPPELVCPLALSNVLIGDWFVASEHASGIESDPTGLCVVVRAAAALRFGDEQAFASEAKPGASLDQLREQAEWLIQRAGG
ncbi:MAG: hypothetical protein ACI9VR_000180 [Cognaticolwellia sp.]